MRFLILLLVFIQHDSIAATLAECRASGSKKVMDFPIQDQNGFGTCYANSSSVVLQSILGQTASVSYQQLALTYQSYSPTARSTDLNDFVMGGYFCETIAAAKKEGVCSDENYRHDASDDDYDFEALSSDVYGNFIKDLGRHRLTNAQWDNLSTHIVALLSQKKERCEEGATGIPKRLFEEKYAQSLLSDIEEQEKFITFYKDQGLNTSSAEEVLTLRKTLQDRTLTRTSSLNGDQTSWSLSPDAMEIIKNLQDTNLLSSAPYKVFLPLLRDDPNAYRKLAGGENLSQEFRQRTYELKGCQTLSTRDILADIDLKAMILSPCETAGGVTDPVVASLTRTTSDILNRLRQLDLRTRPDQFRAYIELSSPACAAEKRETQKRLSTLGCETLQLSSMTRTEGRGVSKNWTPAQENKVNSARDWMTQRICNGRPVSVGVCTDFMRTEGALNTQFCNNMSITNREATHGIHAMAVVGYEIKPDGKTRFLVQNSWGRSCSFEDEQIAAGKDAECELDAEGYPTGRFWISGAVLIQNTMTVSGVTAP